MKVKDITGQKFGKLVALYPTSKRLACNVVWAVQCDCGKQCTAAVFQLTRGKKKSCGCFRGKDLTGQCFGRLTALEPTNKRDGSHVIWRTVCECGTVKEVGSSKLIYGHTQSCGCLQPEVARKLKFIHGLSSTPEYIRAKSNQRRAAKLQRTPKWSDLKAIEVFYQFCPEGHEVDHILPLQGKLVSGLHVLNNLQYLSVRENRSKNNR